VSDAVRVGSLTDFVPGSSVAIEVGGTPLVVVRCQDGHFHAVFDQCSHAQVALSEGEVDGCLIECWLHGSRFDLVTGAPASLPATEPVPVYPVRVRDTGVYVVLKSSNGVDW
jgi:3-phenylpropionate/trans-cinnamate dioxygenase ferredoxin component